jgi:glycosyltransferase involved in cell wall biosynthesis
MSPVGPRHQGAHKVAVVVPVYNTGEYIEPLIASLASQTLPRNEFQVVFVDDGSTDKTPARLDRLADERPNVTVIHQPNSGWPGRPRNVGIDHADADYVYFVDHDDWLGAEALERMTRFAAENDSDIVIGRQAGHHRTIAKPLFERTLPDATLHNAPLMTSLTPHMMFRKAFLDEHGLRFPEGRRRLEDHVFSTRAYFLAKKVSILADYHCYFHIRRPDSGNAAYRPIDPAGYYGNVREVADIVLGHTEPGWVRDESLRRSLRTEILGRLDGRQFADQDEAFLRRVFDEARAVVVDTMPASVDAGLPSTLRARAALLRAGRFDDLKAYGLATVDVGGQLHLRRLAWDDEGGLNLTVSGHLASRDTGRPWQYATDRDGWHLASPHGRELDRTAATVDDAELAAATLQIVARRRQDSQEWTVPGSSVATRHQSDGAAWLEHRAEVRLDPLTLGGGGPLDPGEWDCYGRITQSGWIKDARLGADRDAAVPGDVLIALLAHQQMAAYWTQPHDNLSLHVAAGDGRLTRAVQADPDAVRVDGRLRRTISVRLPLVLLAGTTARGRIQLAAVDGPAHELAATITRTSATTATLAAPLPRLAAGQWSVGFALDVDNWAKLRPTGACVEVLPGRRITVRRAG